MLNWQKSFWRGQRTKLHLFCVGMPKLNKIQVLCAGASHTSAKRKEKKAPLSDLQSPDTRGLPIPSSMLESHLPGY